MIDTGVETTKIHEKYAHEWEVRGISPQVHVEERDERNNVPHWNKESFVTHQSEAVGEQQTRELTLRLVQARKKLGKKAHDFLVGEEIEPKKDHYFTQQELLQLVKEAEAELAERKSQEHKILYPLPEEINSPVNIDSLAQQAEEISEKIQENENSFSFFIDKEKKGEKNKKRRVHFSLERARRVNG